MTLALDACHLADCREALAQLPEDSIDCCVTDPPYGLSREPDIREVLTHWLAGDDYLHKGGGFMGKAWDSFVPGPSYWREVFRVLKPGAHLLAFGGTRTYDLLVIALRLAGFEIRDTLQYLHGQGFPKNHDISKAIDKEAGAVREKIGEVRKTPSAASENMHEGWRRPWAEGHPNSMTITAPATPLAAQWNGWGTALKPAAEIICLARKPISEETIAKNVCAHGTGAINVDGCRIAHNEKNTCASRYASGLCAEQQNGTGGIGYAKKNYGKYADANSERAEGGRWPANVILGCACEGEHEDGCAVKMLDEQAGELTPALGKPYPGRRPIGVAMNEIPGERSGVRHGDSGGASRFFYCAKASPAERDNFVSAERFSGEEISGGGGTQHPKADAYDARKSGRKNCHATVKPIALMRYLCRLICPPGGIVCDPFAGSGTTGIAAHQEGFRFLGFELDPVHHKIAAARLAAAKAQGRLL